MNKLRVQEQQEQEEEEEDYFYESLDRVLSSSSCSSSSSSSSSGEGEGEEEDNNGSKNNYYFNKSQNYNHASSFNRLPSHRFPKSLSNYDIWVSEPSSIEERRKRLLRQMGLSSDPSLSRLKSTLSSAANATSTGGGGSEFLRSAPAAVDRALHTHEQEIGVNSNSDAIVAQSKSGGNPSHSSPSIHKIQTVSMMNPQHTFVNNHDRCTTTTTTKDRVNECNGSVTAGVASSNKPPLGKPSHLVVEEIGCDTTTSIIHNPMSNCSSLLPGDSTGDKELVSVTHSNGTVENPNLLIKNLDDGTEFVVNEFREDGMWNKLREVGTDRQLTMEEFQVCVGHSPIVQELMRRQNVEELNGKKDGTDSNSNGSNGGVKSKKKGSWLRNIKHVASSVTGHKERRSSDEKDTSSERGGRRSSSATDDSQDVAFQGPERARVRHYGKTSKELSALYKSQEIHAHIGSIWTIKFSLDGRYLASAGEDCVIHVWQVVETERKGDLLMDKMDDGNSNFVFTVNGSPELSLVSSSLETHLEKKRRGRKSISRKSISLDPIVVPDSVFALSEKPACSFRGHLADVLDLSWSKSQYLLSSSMDKTVRLWDMDSSSCLKMFTHSDYVTCIQFNPVDDRYFISGSLDAKVRIWSIPDRQVVDWNDLHEMVTAACYTPDGQGALVGSYKGTCCMYNTTENKLQQKRQINLQNKKKKSHLKKITGFQFTPGSSSEVIITSADSRIRVVDGIDLVHKFKGFRNTSSQISASMTSNGKYVVCASGNSNVYVWKHEGSSRPSRSKGVTVTQSYEHFHCPDVSVAIPWPGMCGTEGLLETYCGEFNLFDNQRDEGSAVNHSQLHLEEINGGEGSPSFFGSTGSPLHDTISSTNSGYFYDRISATWPEEKLVVSRNQSPHGSVDFTNGIKQSRSAWGMVIVTAGFRGEIRTFQNFGLPVRI